MHYFCTRCRARGGKCDWLTSWVTAGAACGHRMNEWAVVLDHCSKLVKCSQVEELDGQLVTDAKVRKKESAAKSLRALLSRVLRVRELLERSPENQPLISLNSHLTRSLHYKFPLWCTAGATFMSIEISRCKRGVCSHLFNWIVCIWLMQKGKLLVLALMTYMIADLQSAMETQMRR